MAKMESECPKCRARFDAKLSRKTDTEAVLSPLGSLFIAMKELKNFNIVICSSCGYEFREKGLKFFSIFTINDKK